MTHLHPAGSALRELGRRHGILDGYTDQTGKPIRTSDESRIALLSALGVDCTSASACARSLEALQEQDSKGPIAELAVVERGLSALEPGAAGERGWELTITAEGREPRVLAGRGGRVDVGCLPPGYYELELAAGKEVWHQRRIVTPRACVSVREKTGQDRAFGVLLQLYGLRSARNWGIGDLGDLARFAARAGGEWGAAFLGLNPLHALPLEELPPSPYSPMSRLYRSWIYLDLEAIPELAGERPEGLAALRAAERVDYAGVAKAKRVVLQQLFRRFCQRPASDPRAAAFAAYREREGEALRDFAAFCAMGPDDLARMPDARAPGVAGWREQHEPEIAFHAWLQFELDEQLAAAARAARTAGMPIGLYQDLAVGCDARSADAWAHPELFARGVHIGCPPDPVLPGGQDWRLAPLDPRALRRDGYGHWSCMLQHAFRHSGALRIDHVSGLFRQFWIPEGRPCAEGAFVAYPARELLGILALESARAQAIVIGEDLGTVPEEAPAMLEKSGVLSSRVLYFQLAGGQAGDPKSFPEAALLTVNTHDLPTLAGWWSADDAARMQAAGLIDAELAASVKLAREKERTALVSALRAERLLEASAEVCDETVAAAVHGFLARTPSALLGISLGDLLLDDAPINLPGTTSEQHPNWQRKYRLAIEDLPAAPASLHASLRELAATPAPSREEDPPREGAPILG